MNTALDALRELYRNDVHWWSLVLRAIIVFCAVLLLLRTAGKRAIANMGMAEFVALLLISNAVQNAMNGGDNSLIGGLILATVIMLMSRGFQYATFRWRKVEQLVQGRPTLLIHHGKILHDRLKRELLTVRERTLTAYLLAVLSESPMHYRFAGGFVLIVPSVVFIFAVRRYLFAMWGVSSR